MVVLVFLVGEFGNGKVWLGRDAFGLFGCLNVTSRDCSIVCNRKKVRSLARTYSPLRASSRTTLLNYVVTKSFCLFGRKLHFTYVPRGKTCEQSPSTEKVSAPKFAFLSEKIHSVKKTTKNSLFRPIKAYIRLLPMGNSPGRWGNTEAFFERQSSKKRAAAQPVKDACFLEVDHPGIHAGEGQGAAGYHRRNSVAL